METPEDPAKALLLPPDKTAAAVTGSAYAYALACAVVASVTSIIYGYNRGVMSGAQMFVQADLGVTDAQIEVLLGATSAYSLVGSLAAGWTCDRVGRRRTMALAAAMFFAGSVVTSAASGYAVLMLGQFIAGVASGYGLVVAPVYIAEIAPPASRGLLSSIPEKRIPLAMMCNRGLKVRVGVQEAVGDGRGSRFFECPKKKVEEKCGYFKWVDLDDE